MIVQSLSSSQARAEVTNLPASPQQNDVSAAAAASVIAVPLDPPEPELPPIAIPPPPVSCPPAEPPVPPGALCDVSEPPHAGIPRVQNPMITARIRFGSTSMGQAPPP